MNSNIVPASRLPLVQPETNWHVVLSTRSGQNRTVLRKMLETQALVCVSAPTVQSVADAIATSAALVVMTEEVLTASQSGNQMLTTHLLSQPEWSDLPIILLLKGNRRSSACLTFWRDVAHRQSVVVLDMPLKPTVFTSVVQACLQNRQRQYALRDALYQLKESNQSLEGFSYTAAHELRNPLSVVTSSLDLLKRTDLTAKQQKIAEMGLRTARGMNQTLQALLDYGKLEAYDQNDFRPVDMNYVAEEAVMGLQLVFEARQASVSWVEDLPQVQGNQQLLVRLMSNLIKNAIIHNPGGSPEISLSAELERDRWRLHVRDNGPGIALADQSKVFDLFNRAGGSRADGSGIGLALCRRIVEQHQGEIGVRSEQGAGSDFYFDLLRGDLPGQRALSTEAT